MGGSASSEGGGAANLAGGTPGAAAGEDSVASELPPGMARDVTSFIFQPDAESGTNELGTPPVLTGDAELRIGSLADLGDFSICLKVGGPEITAPFWWVASSGASFPVRVVPTTKARAGEVGAFARLVPTWDPSIVGDPTAKCGEDLRLPGTIDFPIEALQPGEKATLLLVGERDVVTGPRALHFVLVRDDWSKLPAPNSGAYGMYIVHLAGDLPPVEVGTGRLDGDFMPLVSAESVLTAAKTASADDFITITPTPVLFAEPTKPTLLRFRSQGSDTWLGDEPIFARNGPSGGERWSLFLFGNGSDLSPVRMARRSSRQLAVGNDSPDILPTNEVTRIANLDPQFPAIDVCYQSAPGAPLASLLRPLLPAGRGLGYGEITRNLLLPRSYTENISTYALKSYPLTFYLATTPACRVPLETNVSPSGFVMPPMLGPNVLSGQEPVPISPTSPSNAMTTAYVNTPAFTFAYVASGPPRIIAGFSTDDGEFTPVWAQNAAGLDDALGRTVGPLEVRPRKDHLEVRRAWNDVSGKPVTYFRSKDRYELSAGHRYSVLILARQGAESESKLDVRLCTAAPAATTGDQMGQLPCQVVSE